MASFSLTKGYIPAVLLIAILILIGNRLTSELVNSTNAFSNIINISGKQRMLSQKLIVDSSRYHRMPTKENKALLEKSLLELETKYKFINDLLSTKTYSTLTAPKNFDKDFNNYLKNFYLLLKNNNINYINDAIPLSNNILLHLDERVNQFEKQSEIELQRINDYLLYLVIFTLFILALEVKYIFMPASKKIEEDKNMMILQEGHLLLLNNNLELNVKEAVDDLEITKKANEENLVKNTKFNIIGQMAAGITHEINTPLTYMKGITEMSRYDLEDMPDNDFKERLLLDNAEVMDGIKRMGIIIESMREVSQVNNGKKDNFNLYSTLITVLRVIHNRSKQVVQIKVNNEVFKLESSDKEKYNFTAPIQKQRIEQVWTIILNNALDELVKIESYDNRLLNIVIKETNTTVEISIQDNAGGIPDSIKEDIFEPFVSTKESSGIGIGLNIAKKVIDEHQGNLSVINKDKGACFLIVLKKR